MPSRCEGSNRRPEWVGLTAARDLFQPSHNMKTFGAGEITGYIFGRFSDASSSSSA